MSSPRPPHPASAATAPFRGRRLRLGIVLSNAEVPGWIGEVVEEARCHPALEVGIFAEEPLAPELQTARESLLHRIFNRLDKRRAAAHATAKTLTRIDDHLPLQSHALLNDFAPDVIWQIDTALPSEALASIAPYGVWRYRPGSGVREVYERVPESAQVLEVVGPNGQSTHALVAAHVRTHPSSPLINARELDQAGKRLLLDGIQRLLSHAWTPHEFFARHSEAPTPFPEPFRPTNLQMVKFAARVLLPSIIHTRRSSGTVWQWTVGIAPVGPDDSCGRIRADEARFISPPCGSFLADPFVWRHDGGWFVFVEEYPFATGKGHISVAQWREDSDFGPLEPVLIEDVHLSYPFLFEHEGRLLMMPEQHMSDLWAYECVEFPRRWVKHRRVLEGVSCVDGTLLQSDGRWWLFYARVTNQSPDDHLYACHASTPFGPWTQHPLNPIRTGLRGSRMAGNLFRLPDGRLIRPAQDCTACYGGALVFYEVEVLSPEAYHEREVGAVAAESLPPPWNERCHTFNMADNWVVFDACKRIVREQ